MTGDRNVLRITQTPSIWLLAKGSLCASVAVSVLLGILILAGTARAASATEPASEASSALAAEPAPEASPPAPAEPTPEASPAPAAEPAPETSPAPAVEPTVPAAEPAPEASSPAAPVVEAAQEVLSPVEAVVESAPEVPVPVPVVEPAPEIKPPVEPIEEVKEAPAVEPIKEVKEAPAVEPIKEVKEAPAAEPAKEGKEAPVAESVKEAMQMTATAGQDAPADNPAASAGPEVSSAQSGPLTTPFSVISGESQTTSASTYAAALARTIAARRAESFNRELGGLGFSSTGAYTADGLNGPNLLSTSTAFVDDLAGGATSSAGAPASGRSGGSPGGSGPIGPSPGPTPGGTFGGAAGGGAGAAVSGFPMFAGHPMWGAPVAMRRLRLSFQPWLTAFFVLIPERPG